MVDLNRKTIIDAPVDVTKPQRQDVYKELDSPGRDAVNEAIRQRDRNIDRLDKDEKYIDDEIKRQNIRKNEDKT